MIGIFSGSMIRVIRKNSVPRGISANVRDRSESDPAGATESVVGPAVSMYSPET
jgi:hypothetical protein